VIIVTIIGNPLLAKDEKVRDALSRIADQEKLNLADIAQLTDTINQNDTEFRGK
jgi:hypothetical protein